MEYKAFLSHQSEDKPFVIELARCLRKNGVDVFPDVWDVRPGESIPGEIERGLDSSDVFIYVLSPGAFESKWVEAEYHASLFRKLNDQTIRIIPLLRRDADAPPLIAPLKCIDFRDIDLPSDCDPLGCAPLNELLSTIFRRPIKPPMGVPHPALASYEWYFQRMKNQPNGETDYWEIGFKNITDQPLHNFEFAVDFNRPFSDMRYDFKRSSAYFTGGTGLSTDGKRYHWFGNQIIENRGWVVFMFRCSEEPVIARLSTRLLGRTPDGMLLIPPDPAGLQ